MTTPTDLEDLLCRWHDLRRQGRDCSAEELCAGRPELAAALARAILELERMEELMPLESFAEASPDPKAGLPGTLAGYEILEKLGEGSMGIVYRARECASGRVVALKTMKRISPESLQRFRSEWRIMHAIRHPNLVSLYDMKCDSEQWFFTMQLLQGQPFLNDLCAGPLPETSPVLPAPSSEPSGEGTRNVIGPDATSASPAFSLSRVRDAFRQLAGGISKMHEHGVLHRDIKPSNVMETVRGEVVLLDYGLAAEAALDERSVTQQGIEGTMLYMAPEQADGRPVKASDWYSFGVMLFLALTGRHPFEDTEYAMPWTRKDYDSPAPHCLVPGIPEDLGWLCAELLRADPSARPSGQEVCCRLVPVGQPTPVRATSPAPVFLAREGQLADLTAAYADARNGRTVTILLHGPSGIGKSALVRHFVSRLRQTDNRVRILEGRCYERESVPYKALDGLVESLSRFWRKLPLAEGAALLPDGVGPLVRVFPVLQNVEAVAGEIQRLAQRRGQDFPDPHELRRRAFAALREVLARTGRRWPLILCLDDLQWGDVDSALMLAELLLPPEPPPLLLLACFRSEDRDTSPFLRTFMEALAKAGTGLDRREVIMRELTTAEAGMLAGQLLGENATAPTVAESVARESGGNPFFVWQLVQAVQAGDTDLTLDGLIWRRVSALPDGPRKLLQVVAVAGHPLDPEVALRAAGLGDEGRDSLIGLQAADVRLLRAGPEGQQGVETYHDRIREAVVAHLTREERRDHHLRLAIALEACRQADPEVLAVHYEEAEDRERASLYAARAAERAVEALAFARAANLYRRALDLAPLSAEAACSLQQRLGDALANAGRGAEAAQVYLAAATGAAPEQALTLQRQAAEQFLRAGHIEEGVDLFRIILHRVGLAFPETARQIRLQLWSHEVQLWWRGTKFREREASLIPTAELTRMDVCMSAAWVLTVVEPLRGIALNSKFCLLALQAGEPGRVALALGWQATRQAALGGSRTARVEALFSEADRLAEKSQKSLVRGKVSSMRGAAALILGQWKVCCEVLERNESFLRRECIGTAWELGASYHYRFTALRWLGEWKRSAQELPPLLREARERGDLFTTTYLLIQSSVIHLAADEPDRALKALGEAAEQWPARGFHLHHYHALWAEAETALYSGECERAWGLVQERWPALERSLLLRIQSIRLTMLLLRARCALAAACQVRRPEGRPAVHLLKAVDRDVRLIEREGMSWSDAGASLIRAGLAFVRDNSAEADRLLEGAEDGFRAVDMALYAASARYRRGQLLGGERGKDLIGAAADTLARQEIRNPARMLNVFAPGFPAPVPA